MSDPMQERWEGAVDALKKATQPAYDHDAECDEANHAELRTLRVNANRFLRQRNELLSHMRLILAAAQSWNGGWVGKGQSAEEVVKYITETSAIAIAEIAKNGQ